MKLDREFILGLSFVALSLGSTIYLFVATANYLLLYPAIGEVEARVESVSFAYGTGMTGSNLTVHVNAINPSSYSGLKLGGALVLIYFFGQDNASATLFTGSASLSGDQEGIIPFGPHTDVNLVVPILLGRSQADLLRSFYNAQNGLVDANVNLTVEFITFLDSVVGRYHATSIQNVTLSMS